jgi:hypothetical protein
LNEIVDKLDFSATMLFSGASFGSMEDVSLRVITVSVDVRAWSALVTASFLLRS